MKKIGNVARINIIDSGAVEGEVYSRKEKNVTVDFEKSLIYIRDDNDNITEAINMKSYCFHSIVFE